ncbi:hypothetical protein AMS68_001724 [Peltaster fructicola]|uniref:DUS-like FMN-binding domain-containing protein n=1 Tax=Peltaster fructicola TaxID=286661 RepID=A0A6H0XN79_9PEZI|nr:hypothetical protein AMS68_001724 [Peltaster fructicola]
MATSAKRVPIPRNGVDYRGKVVLAPMVRSGECPSRLLALKYGADLVWGPETVDKSLIGTTRHVNPRTGAVEFRRLSSNHAKDAVAGAEIPESIIYRLHPEREGKQHILQLGSADPDTAVAAAKIVAPDVVGVDLNSGCPKPFSTHSGMGAALLRTPDLLCSILEALVKEVGKPNEIGISVKIRLLETPELTRALVERLVGTGITGLTIHCRTTPMRPRERAIREQLRMIGDICRDAGVACLMNGDVTSRDEALALAKEYGVDGGMIATAAETNPSVFRSAEQGGKVAYEQVIREYVEAAMQVENRWSNTKYLLAQMIPGKSTDYPAMTSTKSYSDIVRVFKWDDLTELAKEADKRLELGDFAKPKTTKAERKAERKAAAKATAQGEPTEQSGAKGLKRKADVAGLNESLPLPDASSLDITQTAHTALHV